jgi:pimeloyl-ACP methyl ester carboxylesterase
MFNHLKGYMQKLLAVCVSLVFALGTTTVSAQSPAHSKSTSSSKVKDSLCVKPGQKIDEESFVKIGGIEQWVTIKGSSCSNPVILVLHGGPGNPNTPFAHALYGPWEKDFTVVQWDQRGAGMTYGRNPPGEDDMLTIEQMRDDGLALAKYLTTHLDKRKVILMGGSWSSILGVYMIKAQPELFYAYIGSSHIVNYLENQASMYASVLALAKAAGDADSVSKVEALGPPPWTNPRNFGILRKVDRKYEALATDPAPKSWWDFAPAYTTPKASADYEAGEDYSYVQFVGFKGNGMASKVDLPKLGTRFDLPVYIVQGAEDLLTQPAISRRYFDSISAPQKDYALVPRAGHDPNVAMLAAQYRILTEKVRPLAK